MDNKYVKTFVGMQNQAMTLSAALEGTIDVDATKEKFHNLVAIMKQKLESGDKVGFECYNVIYRSFLREFVKDAFLPKRKEPDFTSAMEFQEAETKFFNKVIGKSFYHKGMMSSVKNEYTQMSTNGEEDKQ